MSVKWTHLLLLGIVSALSGAGNGFAQEAKPAPDFQEVYDLVREHLADANVAELNRAAVEGFAAKLSPRVSLISKDQSNDSGLNIAPISRTAAFDGSIAYIRIGRVSEGLAEALKNSYERLGASNKLKGLVLDLRYASGSNYSSVVDSANLFSKKKRPVLNWGTGMQETSENPKPIALPAAVLVNGETTGAAEALAAVMREMGAALLLGSKTAGQAMISQEFPLKNGERLRIAVSPVELGDGAKLTGEGVAPDISVGVSAQEERAYFADAYAVPRTNLTAASGVSGTNDLVVTNRSGRRVRLNEAELVRERREGRIEPEGGPEAEPIEPGVQDPALARAIDVLKGLAVIRHIGS